MDFVYDEISEALGEEPGFFDAARVRGEHVHPLRPDDPRGRPDDHVRQPGGRGRVHRLRPDRPARPRYARGSASAAEPGATGSVPQPVHEEAPCTRRTARSTSSSIATCTTGTPPRTTGSRAPSSTPRAGSNASTPTRGLGPPETHWSIEHFQKYSEDDLMKDVFEDGYVDVAVFQPTYLKEWYKEGFNTTERNAADGAKHPGKFIAQHPLRPARRRRGPGAAQARRRARTAPRASSSTPPSGTTAPAATS